jgi:hypothetical protein
MTGLNFRGMRESILVLLPIFLGFVVLHFGLIVYGVAVHGDHLAAVVPGAVAEAHSMSHAVGPLVVVALLMRAFSLVAVLIPASKPCRTTSICWPSRACRTAR